MIRTTHQNQIKRAELPRNRTITKVETDHFVIYSWPLFLMEQKLQLKHQNSCVLHITLPL